MLELREHQKVVVNKIFKGFEDGHKRQLLYAPTGFGKTEVAMHIMKEMSNQYVKTAMILDRIVLVEQTSQRLQKYHISHGVLQSGHWRYRPYERIQICSSQTLERRESFPEMDLLIIDECHIQRRAILDFIKENENLKVIGLTATPFTNGLGNLYTNVVGASSTSKLIENGWLCDLRVFIAKEIDMTGVTKVAGEWSQDQVTERGMQITGDIVNEWIKVTHDIHGKPVKSIVFCAGVDHGRDLEDQFRSAGYNFVSISYKEEDDYKRSVIEEFSKPDSKIMGLIATDILTRGFDVTDVMIGVSARPFSKSFSSHVQQMGRVMRSHDGKKNAIWLDHSGNYLRFKDDWEELFNEGVTSLKEGKETTRKEPTIKEKEEAKCVKCNSLWIWGLSDTCGNCGHVKQRKKIATVPGQLEEFNAIKLDLEKNKKFYQELMYYGKMRNYKEGWAAYKYKDRYDVFPPRKWNNEPIVTPSKETEGWIKSQLIRFAHRRAK
jgi:hypothetical protein